jgi:hypothetical protein
VRACKEKRYAHALESEIVVLPSAAALIIKSRIAFFTHGPENAAQVHGHLRRIGEVQSVTQMRHHRPASCRRRSPP